MAIIRMKWTSDQFPNGMTETFSIPGETDQAGAEALARETLNFYNETLRPTDFARMFVSAEILPDDHPDAFHAYALYGEGKDDPEPETDPADERDEFDEDDEGVEEVLFDDFEEEEDFE